jgi:DegV family protein with EDD domain
MRYGIVVDSSCDLKEAEYLTKAGIDYSRVPLFLRVGEREFIDDHTLDVVEFMDELSAWKGKSGSAAPSPERWLQAYSKSEMVFVLTITGALSGSYESAIFARTLFQEQYPERKIHVIDTRSTGPEMVLLVKKLAELIGQGLDFEEIVEKIEQYREHTHLLFILQSMENLVKNGRVSKVAGSLAGVLGIKILGRASEGGTLELCHRCRGKFSAQDKAIALMEEMGYCGGPVVISHCLNPEKANYVRSKLRVQFPMLQAEMMPTGGLCSYYAERGGLLIGFETGA